MKSLEKILGGSKEVEKNANAFKERVHGKDLISETKHPVIYSILKKIAKKRGVSVEYLQKKDVF